jgi:nucleotide-binding universal stress UspA family protein
MKTILVPVDFSSATVQVCDAAQSLAKLIGARLVPFHAVQTPPFLYNDYYSFDTGTMAEVIAVGEKAADAKLEALRRRYMKKHASIEIRQRRGGQTAMILKEAKSLKTSYIVIGSHGHGAVFDLLVGSTTHGVLRKARCPVLVVPINQS